MVLKPVAHLIGQKRLLVVADGALQYIPFDALPTPGASDRDLQLTEDLAPLVLQNEIINLASASTLAVIRQGERPKGDGKLIVVLADPVFESNDPRIVSSTAAHITPTGVDYKTVRDIVAPGQTGIPRLLATRQEAEAIMAVTPWGEGLTAMDFDAGSAITNSGELGRYRIVHFATHGVVDTNHPELSGIMLSRFNESGVSEDGFLQLHDIYNLDLSQTQLVVLSACRTGLGKDVKGEGLIGLTRGFMYAGSKSVIASLWKVDDRATAELMKHFYQAMFEEGLTPAAALRKAKESMWRQSRWRAPYFWAAFVLQGEYKDPVLVPPRNHVKSYTLIILFVLLLVAGVIYTIKRSRRETNGSRCSL
jgi:CHAT domain-containing protein